jgi:hypothetical protein
MTTYVHNDPLDLVVKDLDEKTSPSGVIRSLRAYAAPL